MADRDDLEPDDNAGESGDDKSKEKVAPFDPATFTSAVRDLATELRKAPVVDAPPPAAPTITPEQINAARTEIQAAYQKLCEEGKFGDAANYLMSAQAELNSRLQSTQDPTTAPAYKAMLSTAKRAIKAENPELFESYGDEIMAEVNRLPVADRINADAWNDVLDRVRGRHVDDLIKRANDKAKGDDGDEGEQRRTGQPFPRQAEGSRGRVATKRVQLTTEQVEAAQLCGMSNEEYSKAVSGIEGKIEREDRSSRGMVKVVPDEVLPGKF